MWLPGSLNELGRKLLVGLNLLGRQMSSLVKLLTNSLSYRPDPWFCSSILALLILVDKWVLAPSWFCHFSTPSLDLLLDIRYVRTHNFTQVRKAWPLVDLFIRHLFATAQATAGVGSSIAVLAVSLTASASSYASYMRGLALKNFPLPYVHIRDYSTTFKVF